MTRAIILIGIGGGIGSILRYFTTVYVMKNISGLYPWGTFAVNILGCLLIGILLGFFERSALANPDLKFLFITGFCGGYTTFSTFATENVNLFQSGNTLTAFAYIAASVLVSLLAVWAGMYFTR